MELKIVLLFSILLLLEVEFSYQSSPNENLQKRGYRIPVVKDGEALEPNGSIVIYSRNVGGEAEEKREELLIRVFNNVKGFGIKLKKVDCGKHGNVNKKCRQTTDTSVVYLYKNGNEKMLPNAGGLTTDRVTNEVLFFVTLTDENAMITCSDLMKANEIVEMSRGIFNVIVASFEDFGSAELRHYLEAVLNVGKDFAFVIVESESVRKEFTNSDKHFVYYYNSLHASATGKIERYVISHHVTFTTRNFKEALKTLMVTKDFETVVRKSQNAQKEQERKIEEMKAKEKEKIDKLKMESRIYSEKKIGINGTYKRATPDIYPNVPTKQDSGVKAKHEDDEIAQDVTALKKVHPANEHVLTEVQFDRAKHEVEGKRNILLVLFFVPWDPVYRRFEQTFNLLATETEKSVNIKVKLFDCSASYKKCEENNIKSYPSLVLYKKGSPPLTYHGLLDNKEIKKHIQFWQDDFLPEMTEIRQLEDISKQVKYELIVMAIFDKHALENVTSPFKMTAWKLYGKVKVGMVRVKKSHARFQGQEVVSPCAIALNANGVSGRSSVYEGDFQTEALLQWINQQLHAEVEELTFANFPRVMSLRKPLLISFREKQRDRSSLRKLANRNKEVVTLWMDVGTEVNQQIHKSYNLQQNETIILLDKIKGTIFEFNEGKRTILKVSNWIEECLRDKNATFQHKLTEKVWKGKEGIDFLTLVRQARTNQLKRHKIKRTSTPPEKIDGIEYFEGSIDENEGSIDDKDVVTMEEMENMSDFIRGLRPGGDKSKNVKKKKKEDEEIEDEKFSFSFRYYDEL